MAGDIKYLDLDGNGVIDTGANTLDDPGDRRVIGNNRPRYNYSFRGDFTWNGFDFQMFFQGVGKLNWMPDANCIYFWNTYSYHRPTFIPKDFEEKCWSSEEGADNSKALFPRRRGRMAASSYLVTSDYWLQNASYIRLKNLSVGYTMPAKWFAKTKAISGCRIYFTGSDLWEHSDILDGWDPEAKSNPSATARYPFVRTFTFGANLTF